MVSDKRELTLLYFAWVRQRTGIGEERIELPGEIATIGDLIGYLTSRGEGFKAAFGDPSVIRAAVDQEHVGMDFPIGDAREIAFFPPVTGG